MYYLGKGGYMFIIVHRMFIAIIALLEKKKQEFLKLLFSVPIDQRATTIRVTTVFSMIQKSTLQWL